MLTLLIVADDFTGALDTSVKMVQSGVRAVVLTDVDAPFESFANVDVLVIDSETRHFSPQQAGERVRKITKRAFEHGIKCVYKKTDSALRANIGAELEAVIQASGAKQLMFVPAFPQMKRISVDGVLYIDGVPVAESVFGKDPFEPVRHSDIREIIAEQSSLPVHLVRRGELWNAELSGITVFDAIEPSDLRIIGSQLKQLNKLHVLAGCAGFASLLPELLNLRGSCKPSIPKLSRRLLVVCGSVNPITISQMDAAEEAGFWRIRLTPEQKLCVHHWNTPEGIKQMDEFVQIVAKEEHVIIDTNNLDRNVATNTYSNRYGITVEEVRRRIADSIGSVAKTLIDHDLYVGQPDAYTLFITGGDVLMKTMEKLGVTGLNPICELDTGVVLSSFIYREQTRYVLSKSGGFGARNQILRILNKINEINNI